MDWTDLFEEIWSGGNPIIIAAGNAGLGDISKLNEPTSLSEYWPQNAGAEHEELIIVGGVYNDGSLWANTNFDDGTGSSITVYAQSVGVTCRGLRGREEAEGTSLAAPAVAGLAAYLRSLPRYSDFFDISSESPPLDSASTININSLRRQLVP